MEQQNPIVLSMGGWDPCGGAGLAADIKTFEAHKTLGLGVTTALTAQNHQYFQALHPVSPPQIREQLSTLLELYTPQAAKFGLVPSTDIMETTIAALYENNHQIYLIWDPVLRASAGFSFHTKIKSGELFSLMRKISLLTPNLPEAHMLFGTHNPETIQARIRQEGLCPVLLKGGHAQNHANDLLIQADLIHTITGETFSPSFAKHGSGCVLSAAISCELAWGADLLTACTHAKAYTEKFLLSSSSPLGWHAISHPELTHPTR